MNILVLGASGMVGSAIFRTLSQNDEYRTLGTVRSRVVARFFEPRLRDRLITNVDILDTASVAKVFNESRPDVVINCIGVTKHRGAEGDRVATIHLNSLLPHLLADLCESLGARFIHISTDCVFSGLTGKYKEKDPPDARDLYGRSKLLGEVVSSPDAITIRTSFIGHELASRYSLLEWFLSQKEACKGFTKAFFSGFPAVTFARLLRDFVIPKQNLKGLYHVASEPINKYTLLRIVARVYKKCIHIEPDDSVIIDRSLDGSRFNCETGFMPQSWEEMIIAMNEDCVRERK